MAATPRDPSHPHQGSFPTADRSEAPGSIEGFLRDVLERAPSLVDVSRADLRYLAETIEETANVAATLGFTGGRPLAAVFGSARLKPGQRAYWQAWAVGRALRAHQWELITGAGPGGMKAASRGAGTNDVWGASLELAFEKDKAIPQGDRHLHFKHFHSRKRALVDRPDAFICVEGGFGTLDELFETLTLIQTGKRAPAPVVLLERPGSNYWQHSVSEITARFVSAGTVSPHDDVFFHITDSVDDAVSHVLDFYRVFHSLRVEDDTIILRLQYGQTLDPHTIDRINEIGQRLTRSRSGTLELCTPSASEIDDGELLYLPRYRITDFDERSYAALRQVIDAINGVERAAIISATDPLTTYTEALVAAVELAPGVMIDQARLAADTMVGAARRATREPSDLATTFGHAARMVHHPVLRAVLAFERANLAVRDDNLVGSRVLFDEARTHALDGDDRELAAEISIEAARVGLLAGDLDWATQSLRHSRQVTFECAEFTPEVRRRQDIVEGIAAWVRDDYTAAARLLTGAIDSDPLGPIDGYLSHPSQILAARATDLIGPRRDALAILNRYERALIEAHDATLTYGARDASLTTRQATVLIEKALVLGTREQVREDSRGHLENALELLNDATSHVDHVGRIVEKARAELYLRREADDGSGDLQAMRTVLGELKKARHDDFGPPHDQHPSAGHRTRDRLRLRGALATLSHEAMNLSGISEYQRRLATDRWKPNEQLMKRGRGVAQFPVESSRMLIGLGREVTRPDGGALGR